jgi:hypothetical protein
MKFSLTGVWCNLILITTALLEHFGIVSFSTKITHFSLLRALSWRPEMPPRINVNVTHAAEYKFRATRERTAIYYNLQQTTQTVAFIST